MNYEIAGPIRPVIYCHCDQCRKTSGHFVAASACQEDKVNFLKDEALTWYRSSENAQRGFCARCGSSLFWKLDVRNSISIMVGALDRPLDIEAKKHIFTPEVWDYYSPADGLPQYDRNGQVSA